MIALLQIPWRMWQWKNFENRPVFDEVMCRLRRLIFLAHPVRVMPIFVGVYWIWGIEWEWTEMHIYCQWQRCSPRSVVSGDISLMLIFVGVRWWGGVKWECGRRKCEFFPSIAICFAWSSPLALHIDIYTALRGFLTTPWLLWTYGTLAADLPIVAKHWVSKFTAASSDSSATARVSCINCMNYNCLLVRVEAKQTLQTYSRVEIRRCWWWQWLYDWSYLRHFVPRLSVTRFSELQTSVAI